MTIFGWDASHYDWSRGPMDIGSAKADGIVFMTHKVGEGRTVIDARFDDWYKRARGVVPLLGAYYVNHPGDQRYQADRFLALLDDRAPGWRDGPFILQVDAERFGYMEREPSPSEIEAFCDRLVSRTKGEHRPLVYAPRWLYHDRLKGLGYPLWASAYGSNPAVHYRSAYPGDKSDRWAKYSGQTPAILQYGSRTKIGRQSTCDANAFRGTLDELRALVCPEEDDMPYTVEQLRAMPWQYAGRGMPGVPAGHSTLWVLGSTYSATQAILRTLAGDDADQIVAEIRRQGDLTRSALAGAQAAILAALPAGDGPVSREDLVAALTAVLGSVDELPAG